MRHVISVLLQNEVGALTRLTCLFSTRGYNIESLNVAPTEDPAISRLTLVTSGSDAALEQIAKQMNKIVDVVDMHDMTLGEHFERELALIKLRGSEQQCLEIGALCREFGARVIDERPLAFTIEFAGSARDVDQLVARIEKMGEVIALVRSGTVGISRGERVLAAESLPVAGELM